LSIFRKPVKPIWEDVVNSQGGEFSAKIAGLTREEMKDLWNRLVFHVIGNTNKYTRNVRRIIGIRT